MRKQNVVPKFFPVRPLERRQIHKAKDAVQCSTCERWWDDAIVTAYTPAPSARCPFEEFHEHSEPNGRTIKPLDAVPFGGPDRTNEDRIDTGRQIVDAYGQAMGQDESNLSDLLADLMHYAKSEKLDFDAEVERGRFHFEAEDAGDE